jgi:hypothetical protein
MIVLGNFLFSGVMHAEDFNPIILEIEFVSLRRDFHRVLREHRKREQGDKRQTPKERHRFPSLNVYRVASCGSLARRIIQHPAAFGGRLMSRWISNSNEKGGDLLTASLMSV